MVASDAFDLWSVLVLSRTAFVAEKYPMYPMYNRVKPWSV